MLKSISLVILVVLFMNCVPIESGDTPILSINEYLNRTELEKLPSGIYIGQALNYIFTGSYDGTNEIGDDFDEVTLDGILALGLELLAEKLKEDPPDDFIEIIGGLQDIILKLNRTGSSSVLFKELKPYIKYLTPKNLALFYLSTSGPAVSKRFRRYLEEEFFGDIEGLCKAQNLLWVDDIQLGKFWAIEMFDSMAKIPAGILSAHINWVGSYKQCNNILNRAVVPNIKGRYCRAIIGFPIDQISGDFPVDENIGLTYGMCVPDACRNREVESIVSNSLKLLTVFKSSWVKEIKCDEETPVSTASTVYIILLSLLVAWVIISTIFDVVKKVMIPESVEEDLNDQELINMKKALAGDNVIETIPKNNRKKKNHPLVDFMINCSLYTNIERFFRTDNGGKITCLNGMRAISMVWIVWGHTYNYIGDRTYFFLLDNLRDLQELNEEAYAQLIINAMYGVDTFFLMSAFLLTISFLNKLEKSGGMKPFEWVYYYVHRYWRLVPPFMITIVIYIWIMPYVGSGPLWVTKDFPLKYQDCHEYWWAYLLFVNNFIPEGRGTKCMGYLWYIPNDYQFYAISPLFLYILYKFPSAGKILIGFVISASLAILSFLTANVYESRKRNIIQVLIDMWDDVYIKPYCRATPWLVGILLGYIFFKNKKIKLSKFTVAIGWLLSTGFALTAIFGGYTNHANNARKMKPEEYALFFSLTRLSWPLSISWIIFACYYGYGGVINSILSSKAFIPITRLSYCAYLIHPPVMVFYYFTQHTLFHATGITLIYVFFGNVVTTFIIAFFFTLFFEQPFIAFEKLVFPRAH